MITQELIKSLFDYDPNTGVFKRKVTVSNNAKAGQIINKTDFEGYLKVAINKNHLRFIDLYGFMYMENYQKTQ